MVRSPDDTTKSSRNVRVTMNSGKLLLTICFHVIVFETDALQRFHRNADNTRNEIDELSDYIRIHHQNQAFKFDIPGPRNRKIKRKLTDFAIKAHVAPEPGHFSKRWFPDVPYGYGLPPVSSPAYVSKWWPSGFDPRWPEYGVGMDGYGYSVQDPYAWNGFGTWNQPYRYFPSRCVKWCSEYCLRGSSIS